MPSEVRSVRMPVGTVGKLKEAYGMDFSTLVRFVMLGLLRDAERAKRARAAQGRLEINQAISNIITLEIIKDA